MKRRNYFIISCLMLIAPATVQAQFDKGLNYKIETSATVSGGHNTPFWLVANKHGLSSIRKTMLTWMQESFGIWRRIKSSLMLLDWKWSVRVASRLSSSFNRPM